MMMSYNFVDVACSCRHRRSPSYERRKRRSRSRERGRERRRRRSRSRSRSRWDTCWSQYNYVVKHYALDRTNCLVHVPDYNITLLQYIRPSSCVLSCSCRHKMMIKLIFSDSQLACIWNGPAHTHHHYAHHHHHEHCLSSHEIYYCVHLHPQESRSKERERETVTQEWSFWG